MVNDLGHLARILRFAGRFDQFKGGHIEDRPGHKPGLVGHKTAQNGLNSTKIAHDAIY
jgi:hypothetical protein